jgi:tetratricopeptide (TPR) repeat protein
MDDVHLERAMTFMELERYEEAIRDYKKVWLDEAYGSEDVLDFVECLIELDHLDQAIAILYDAVDRFPEVLQFRLVLAGYLFASDDMVSAKAVLDDLHLNRDELRTLFAEYFPDLLEIPIVASILAELK